jgi:hypothetical protein
LLSLVPIFFVLIAIGNAVNAQQVDTPYDLTGTWILRAIDVQRSFCDGSIMRDKVELEVDIIQSESDITLVFVDDLEEQIFEGRTSNYFIGAESNDESQVTVLSGKISKHANLIVGTIVFFDKHECPEAETGAARFRLVRTSQ